MGKKYKQLGIKERERIMVLYSLERSHGEIALDIGRSKSTVARELNRNRSSWGRNEVRFLFLNYSYRGNVDNRD